MNKPELHLAVLEAKLTEYVAGLQGQRRANWRNQGFFWAMVIGILLTTGVSTLSMPSWALLVVGATGLLIEIIGVIGIAGQMISQVRELLPLVRNQHGVFAHVLDREFVMYRDLVSWLQNHGVADLRAHLAYVRGRRDMMRRKLGLITGGSERLGVLPLLVALYLQARDLGT
jgi:hypothetical protein